MADFDSGISENGLKTFYSAEGASDSAQDNTVCLKHNLASTLTFPNSSSAFVQFQHGLRFLAVGGRVLRHPNCR